jgi:hypothetical protein
MLSWRSRESDPSMIGEHWYWYGRPANNSSHSLETARRLVTPFTCGQFLELICEKRRVVAINLIRQIGTRCGQVFA